jgi:hypothetical protein
MRFFFSHIFMEHSDCGVQDPIRWSMFYYFSTTSIQGVFNSLTQNCILNIKRHLKSDSFNLKSCLRQGYKKHPDYNEFWGTDFLTNKRN